MKRVGLTALAAFAAALTVFYVPAWPQSTDANPGTPAAEMAALKDIKGMAKVIDGKLKFVTDEDNKVWTVMNPETLKGHQGEHVQLNVHMFPAKSAIHVHTVKQLKD